uniref:Uncharacterized protein n=1 Tax=Salix viminalis TaxID=40686 RepID=A0A6N2MQ24_SALVM
MYKRPHNLKLVIQDNHTMCKFNEECLRLSKVKQTMESHILVEKESTLHHGPPCFTKDKQLESPLNRLFAKTRLLS